VLSEVQLQFKDVLHRSNADLVCAKAMSKVVSGESESCCSVLRVMIIALKQLQDVNDEIGRFWVLGEIMDIGKAGLETDTTGGELEVFDVFVLHEAE